MPCFEDIQIEASDSRLDISTNREPKWDVYTSKSRFGCRQPETNHIMEVVAIVSWLPKYFAFFLLTWYYWWFAYDVIKVAITQISNIGPRF